MFHHHSPFQSYLAYGTDQEIVSTQSVRNLNPEHWSIGINSISILKCPGSIDCCFALTTSLVQKDVTNYFRSSDSENNDPLHVIKISNQTEGRHINIRVDSDKLFRINNIGHRISFQLQNLSQGEKIKPLTTVIHYSLYYRK
jgi:hypothetical protein